ncbi:hypothetical protein ACOSQ2_022574 [Xanthoceras sorbifolium]
MKLFSFLLSYFFTWYHSTFWLKSMVVKSSSTIDKSDSIMSSLPGSIQPQLIAKTMNFNLPIKLSRENYTYWKALVMPAIRAIGHEYDPVVMLVSQQNSISFHEAQYMLMIREQRINHLSSTSQIDAPPSANLLPTTVMKTMLSLKTEVVLLMVVDETTIIEGREAEIDRIIPTPTDLPVKFVVGLVIQQVSATIGMIEMPVQVLLGLLMVLYR